MRARTGIAMAIMTVSPLAMAACGTSATGRGYQEMLGEYDRLGPPEPDRGDGEGGAVVEGAALDRAALVRAVLESNPDVEAARQAWRAALAEVPQAEALEDPMLEYAVAPLSIVGDAPLGHRIQLSQRLPWPGKRRLRAEVALAEAEAARSDFDRVRLELALLASDLYDDYYVVARSLEINERHRELLEQMKKSAEAQYVVGRASQQDPIQAEVELAHLAHDRIVLETQREVLVAQMNGLLHREPAAPLPPPPAELAPLDLVEKEPDELIRLALEQRPELEFQAGTVRAGEVAVDLARREFYPDLAIMGSYNSMWGMTEHQWMLGVGVNLPVWRERRHAAVDEARARTARAERERERLVDRIRVEVTEAHARAREAHHVVELYRNRLLPAARDQVDAALAGLTAGQNSFLAVVEAENNLRTVELRYETARAALQRREAALQRATGRIPGLPGDGGGR